MLTATDEAASLITALGREALVAREPQRRALLVLPQVARTAGHPEGRPAVLFVSEMCTDCARIGAPSSKAAGQRP